MLISPTEPQRLKELGTVSSKPERYGCDFLILGGRRRVGVQRKKFPEDLLSSIADGRLYEQLAKMQELDLSMYIIEGYGHWSNDGELIFDQFSKFRIDQLYSLLFSIQFEFGVPVMWLPDMAATAAALQVLDDWATKEKHTSLKRRPKAAKDTWGRASNLAFASHILQSFPGVGPDTAENIVGHFGMLPLTWTVTFEEMMDVPGVGKVTAKKLIDGLDELEETH